MEKLIMLTKKPLWIHENEYFYIFLACGSQKMIKDLGEDLLRIVNSRCERKRGKYCPNSRPNRGKFNSMIEKRVKRIIVSNRLLYNLQVSSFVVLIIIRRCDPSLATPPDSHIYESQTARSRYSQLAWWRTFIHKYRFSKIYYLR